jgi:hypothetical protein
MASTLRLAALVASALVVAGFTTFAVDEAQRGSQTQVRKLGDDLNHPVPSANVEQLRERSHGDARELIDDANDVLLAPFASLVETRSAWVARLVPTALALLAYGLGVSLLANALPQRGRRTRDWRTAS